jgi:hypothetical protein
VGEETTPFARFGGGEQQLPTLGILPGSDRIWCTYNFVPRDLKRLGGDKWTRGKPRTDPVVTYSDDGGETWAEPVYIGSDSGDIGTGVVVLRPFRGRPAWFWAFWDCAPPAWGFFDGSRFRPLREFFPHTSRRTASWHPWDVLEDGRGRMYFATGLSHRIRGQLYKVFDGRAWSDDVVLSGRFGKMVLVDDGKRTFCLACEGGEPRGKRIVVYELDGPKAVRRPLLYTPPEGRFIHRFYVPPRGRRTEGYFPLFLIEEKGRRTGRVVRGRAKWAYEDPRLVYLRAEVKPLEPQVATAEAARPVPDPALIPRGAAQYYKPMPINDTRIEPRTDVSKDRKIVRVGRRWVIVYADDNPGRLLAAQVKAGKTGKSVVLIKEPAWGRFQCSAAADGDDALVAVAGGLEGPRMVRLEGIRNWDTAPPKVTGRSVFKMGLGDDVWPSIAIHGGEPAVAFTRGSEVLFDEGAPDGVRSFRCVPGGSDAPDPRGALVRCGNDLVLLRGSRRGISAHRMGPSSRPAESEPAVREPWVGHHFSAVSDGGRIDVVYAPRASYLGRKIIGHVRYEKGKWSKPVIVAKSVHARGVSLCSLGGGRLMCVYSARHPRPGDVPAGVERLRRFTYSLRRQVFDGKRWGAATEDIASPDIPVRKPRNWGQYNRSKGVVVLPETKRGMFPTLPASSAGCDKVPVAWMVPGFDCVTRYWFGQDRGGYLLSAEIPTGS